MKKDIHPAYNPNAKFTCACGAKYEIGSTLENMKVELCSACHPFYTGKQKIVDTARRVEKFKTREAKKQTGAVKSKTTKREEKRVKRASKTKTKKEEK